MNNKPLWVRAYKLITKREVPDYFARFTVFTMFKKMLRKWVTNSVAPSCPVNIIRIWLYKLCGFKIGRNVFIGMHCYLDDLCFDILTIGNNVTISYGVYFACHGRKQGHYPITIEDGAYIGMCARIISKNTNGGGGLR